MRMARIYSDGSGKSNFGEIDLSLADGGEIGLLSQHFEATGIIFRETPGDYDYSWHNAPRRPYLIILDGEVYFTVSSSETRRFGAGDGVLLEDTSGREHAD